MEDSLEMTFISLLYSILEQCLMLWLLAHVFRVADQILDFKAFEQGTLAQKGHKITYHETISPDCF